MNDFGLYFVMGWHHIISWDALDHLLFIAALAAIYQPHNWKQVLILVTAFTIGHSLTLALSVYELIRVSERWVEFLIPCTIMVTAMSNFFIKDYNLQSPRFNYWLALCFGLIHGLGFANTIRFMLASNQSIASPLFAFNIGLEAGQVLVVALLLLVAWLFIHLLQLKQQYWVNGLSLICLIIAATMAFTRLPL